MTTLLEQAQMRHSLSLPQVTVSSVRVPWNRSGSAAHKIVYPVVWVAYAFYAVPLVSSLANLHMKTTSDSGKA